MTRTHEEPGTHGHEHGHGHGHGHGPTPVMERHTDVAVVGGSAAGLAAALQIARQRRGVVVIDDQAPRNASAAHMHGYLGHEGVAPTDLVARGREEVRSFGGEILLGRVLAVAREEDGRFRLDLTGGHTLVVRRVVVATGLTDKLPDVEGLAQQWGTGVVHCPFCHGFEVRDRRLVQVVAHPWGLHATPLWRHLTDALTVVLHDETGIDPAVVAGLEAAGVRVERARVRRVRSSGPGHVQGVELEDGRVLDADAVVTSTRLHARVDVLSPLGLTSTEHPSGAGTALTVDPRGQTVVPGVYAAGNVADPMLQVLPAAANGSQVGAMVAADLAAADLQAPEDRVSGEQAEWDQRYAGREPVWSGNPNGTLVHEVASLPPGRALDVGTGEGADAIWLAEHGWSVLATDISGNALARLATESARRGLDIGVQRSDVNAPEPFGDAAAFDLVSLQYGSFKRTPDGRGLHALLDAVAPGGTLLVVHHDQTPLHGPVDVATQTRMYDPAAFVGVAQAAAALAADPDVWDVEVHETRPRPTGAASAHHVDDVVLRARRRR